LSGSAPATRWAPPVQQHGQGRSKGMNELSEKLEREVLPLVSRPSRYTGGERNVPEKDPADAEVTFLLAFPDVYEIGMSHLGIRVLYDILMRRQEIAVERVFAPWIDMETLMREKGIPLFSVESRRAARDFDVVGFTLQYELHYPEILTMLDLAEIPLRADERRQGDPLVIGGGPCAFNPEPLALFFDLFVIGDGESAVLDLADLLIEAKRENLGRCDVLERAARLTGVYVPSLYRMVEREDGPAGVEPIDARTPRTVVGRAEKALGYAHHPCRPLVPVSETTHDRLAIEIMRGCTRGCRFCQAGMVTRPVRECPAEDIARLAEEGVAASGYDEVSLVSLSASDHSELSSLVERLNEALFDRRVSISLPSLRADEFGMDLADGIGRVRKAGLTFAPEAGTQRLRDLINKNETEENILATVDVAFAAGWSRVKLYFMVGLPTETEADLEGIAELVRRVREVARRHRKGASLSVSISPFVPKPHTPFQWERQDRVGETISKERLLGSLLRMKGVKVSLRNPEVSRLEGVLARGDRKLADAIEEAWRGGARFGGWGEAFDAGVWDDAFRRSGIDPEGYLGPFDPGSPLPWDHVASGPTKAFLLAERERALRGETTPDCREAACLDCGACGPPRHVGREMPPMLRQELEIRRDAYGRRDRRRRPGNGPGSNRWRVRYAKRKRARFLSHLDMARALRRAFSASGLPIAYTQGFNPHPKLSFGPPLPVGATGEAEFVEVEFLRQVARDEIAERVAPLLPAGMEVMDVTPVQARVTAAASACAAEYEIRDLDGLAGLDPEELRRRVSELRSTDRVTVERGDGTKDVFPAERILSLELVGEAPPVLRTVLAVGEQGVLRPGDVVRLLYGGAEASPELAHIHRLALFGRRSGGGLEPLG
jgi:radical SAM family uncharacterized protein/radical SAM-linked protein